MGTYTMNLPDIGEGIAEAEIDEWMVKVGDIVAEDDVLCSVMTDKAAVEVPTAVSGVITWIAGDAGDTLAIGAPLIKFEVEGAGLQMISYFCLEARLLGKQLCLCLSVEHSFPNSHLEEVDFIHWSQLI